MVIDETATQITTTECEDKNKLLTENAMLKQLVIPKEKSRLTLPFKKDLNQKVNIWQILKEAVGKDITSFSVPV